MEREQVSAVMDRLEVDQITEIEATLERVLDQRADLKFELEGYSAKLELTAKLLGELDEAEIRLKALIATANAQQSKAKRVIVGVYDAEKVAKDERVKPRVMFKLRKIVRSIVHHAEGIRLDEDGLKVRVRAAASSFLGTQVERISSLHWKDARDVVIELQRVARARGIELAYEVGVEPTVNV
jgi:hypothetical protein